MISDNIILARIRNSFTYRTKDLLHRVMKATSPLWSHTLYLKIRYRSRFGRKLDLENPVTFNEKINWLKLHYTPDSYSKLVDKYEVKKIVAELIGDEHIIPTIGVWDDPDEIDFDSLPEKFVLKCNHNSGKGMYICKDKRQLNRNQVRRNLRKGLKEKHYMLSLEFQYKNVKPLILAEQYMEDEPGGELKDYKFFCFNGKVKFCKVDFDRFTEHHANYYDLDWNQLPFEELFYPANFERIIDCPPAFERMIEIAEKLADGIPFVRVDLYNVFGKIYFGELTFTPYGGMGPFVPDEWDYKIGELLILPSPIV